jgi:glycosyltransferase involved in cell wall biosynthesis
MSRASRPAVAIYLLDQDRETTSSLGIFHCTRNLVRTMSELPDPGFEVSLWVGSANQAAFRPPVLPDWMNVVRVNGRYGNGVRRLVADHVAAPCLALAHRPRVLHFPKGWMPLWLPGSVRGVATLHDTIIQYYRATYPDYFPRLKTAYFHRMALHSLRRADHVITLSDFSARELTALAPGAPPPIKVIPPAGLHAGVAPPRGARRGLLVIGSPQPHKATAETLRRLDAYAAARGFTEPVMVAGVPGPAAVPGAAPPRVLRADFVGRVPFDELQRRMAASRALVVLSEIEGFGLPLLEAYAVHTPVCFRNTTAMAEVLEQAPGAWDGRTDESFFDALDACLALSAGDIAAIRNRLAERFNWRRSVEATLDVYRGLLEHRSLPDRGKRTVHHE